MQGEVHRRCQCLETERRGLAPDNKTIQRCATQFYGDFENAFIPVFIKRWEQQMGAIHLPVKPPAKTPDNLCSRGQGIVNEEVRKKAQGEQDT